MLAWALALGGCTSIPVGRSSIDAVHVEGTKSLDEGAVTDKIATAPTEKFFGLFRGVVYDYQVYDPSVVQRDLARVERYYRGKGFLDAHARAARVSDIAPGHVRVDIVVEEGPPTSNRAIALHGGEDLPAVHGLALAAALDALPVGARFDEDAYRAAQAAVLKALTDNGYAYATSKAQATIDLGAHAVDYEFTVVPGPRATFGAITIAGLDPDGNAGPRPQEISQEPLMRAIDIAPGEEYSTAKIDSAVQALLDLEVFTAVKVEPQLTEPPPPNAVVPLLVKVEPTRLREVRLGFGGEFDEIKTELHLLASWEDHNFLGGLRDFTVTFQPGAVLYPLRVGNYVTPSQLLPGERLKLELRQPSFLEARTAGFIKPELNVYPLLVEPNPPPDDPVVGYVEGKGAVGVDRPFGKLFVSLAYNAQVEVPIGYVQTLDPTLSSLFLAYPELVTTLDFRDDHVHTHSGIYLSNSLQSAGGPFGGQVADVKVQPEVRTYIPLGRRVTFATRASIGFLFARNYGDVVQTSELFAPITPGNKAEHVEDIEKVYFRGFFSGGPSSNRGFPIRGVAPYGYVPFLNPATAALQQANGCNPNNPKTLAENCLSPIGGFSLWEFSNELRVNIAGPFATAVFCDMSDVAAQQLKLRLDHPHLSCGVGARYDTPVGPIRLDVGYRIEPLQVLGYANDYAAQKADPTEGVPARFGNVPLALAFGIGEAY
jgi:outer membrane protein insertion porin family/translocation and assembly module TamA